MGRRNKHHYLSLPTVLQEYCGERTLDFHQYSMYHMRLTDGGYTTIDIWTTGRYYVLMTDYKELAPDLDIAERGGEKGNLPNVKKEHLTKWLDKLFYAADMESAK